MNSKTNFKQPQITDAHVHFWDLDKMNYPWLDDVPPINRSFGLADYREATSGIPVGNMIFVQCECLPAEYRTEVAYISELALQDTRIRGIVAYFPLEEEDVEVQLQALANNKLVKGIRRLEGEALSLYENTTFNANMDLLPSFNLSFDLGVKAHQLLAAVRLVRAKPNIRYMLDHFGKPNIKGQELQHWKRHVTELASHPGVYCKLSGLVTEADFEHWSIDDLQPYVDVVFERFGSNRVSFGGDWPVVTLASTYTRWFDTAMQLCDGLTNEELYGVFYQNALDFYQITV